MPTQTAQDEFNTLIHGTGRHSPSHPHPEDSTSHRSSSEDPPSTKPIRSGAISHSDSDSDSPPYQSTRSTKPGRYYIPSARSAANTGPKGVIADAQAFHDAKRAFRSAAHLPAQQQQQEEVAAAPQTWLLDEDEEGDSGDEDFLVRWRAKRLRDMQSVKMAVAKGGAEKRGGGGGRWGSLGAVDAGGFLDAVEGSGEGVVVVFIYDERVCCVPTCVAGANWW